MTAAGGETSDIVDTTAARELDGARVRYEGHPRYRHHCPPQVESSAAAVADEKSHFFEKQESLSEEIESLGRSDVMDDVHVGGCDLLLLLLLHLPSLQLRFRLIPLIHPHHSSSEILSGPCSLSLCCGLVRIPRHIEGHRFGRKEYAPRRHLRMSSRIHCCCRVTPGELELTIKNRLRSESLTSSGATGTPLAPAFE